MASSVPREAIDSFCALKRRVGPVFTAAEAEAWWPLALSIDASVTVSEPAGIGRKASHDLLWAVSDAIRTLKRSGEPDVGKISVALTELEREVFTL